LRDVAKVILPPQTPDWHFRAGRHRRRTL